VRRQCPRAICPTLNQSCRCDGKKKKKKKKKQKKKKKKKKKKKQKKKKKKKKNKKKKYSSATQLSWFVFVVSFRLIYPSSTPLAIVRPYALRRGNAVPGVFAIAGGDGASSRLVADPSVSVSEFKCRTDRSDNHVEEVGQALHAMIISRRKAIEVDAVKYIKLATDDKVNRFHSA